MLSLEVNGKIHRLNVDPEMPLLWALRDYIGLTGAKYSCGIGECGACTVHVDGKAVQSCTVTVGEMTDQKITTIEGLQGKVADALFEAWSKEDVPQCGYCQPAQIMQAAELLGDNNRPTDMNIDEAMSGVLCRCGTYQDIRKAIQRAAKEI